MRAVAAAALLFLAPASLAVEAPNLPPEQRAHRPPPGKFLAPNYYVPRSFESDTITVEAGDAYRLSGDYIFRERLPRKLSGVLFLHDAGGTKRDWYPLTVQTAGRGFAVLAMDLRGHGENPALNSVKGKPLPLADADFARMLDDVRQALGWLRMQKAVVPDSIAIIGMGLGANLGMAAAAAEWGKEIRCVISLSPRLADHGYSAADAVPILGKRGLYFVAAKGDAESFADSLKLFEAAKGPKEMLPVEGTARGRMLFGAGLMHRLPVWLSDNLPPGPAAGGRTRGGK